MAVFVILPIYQLSDITLLNTTHYSHLQCVYIELSSKFILLYRNLIHTSSVIPLSLCYIINHYLIECIW